MEFQINSVCVEFNLTMAAVFLTLSRAGLEGDSGQGGCSCPLTLPLQGSSHGWKRGLGPEIRPGSCRVYVINKIIT